MNKNTKKVKNNSKRKVRKSFLFVMFVFIIALLVILSTTVFFPIGSVTLKYGGELYSEQQILKQADIKIGENLIMLPKNKISKRVTKNLTYIGELKIEKEIPDKVILTAKETDAMYCIKFNKKYYVLDKNFKVLEEIKKANKKLIGINGMKLGQYEVGELAEVEKTDQYESFKNIVKYVNDGGDKLNYINFTKSGEIEFFVNGKFKVQLGTVSELDNKLAFMSKMIDEITKKNKKDEGRINLTYFPSKKEGYFTRETVEINYFS